MPAKRFIIRTFTFLVMAAILALALHALNWVPELLRPGLAKAYPDIETVSRDLGIRNVPAPAYFPEQISWPPSTIVAQNQPYQAVLLQFTSQKTTENIMVINKSPIGKKPLLKTSIDNVVEQSRIELRESEAVLLTGTCKDQRPCSLVTWQSEGQQISVLLYARPFELIKIAQSIHP